jgi:thiamine-monophosphate kinase
MIDISDGLSTDLTRILTESGVSARIYKDRLPAADGADEMQILHGGEEYELLITAPELPERVEGVPLSCIGEIVASSPGKENQIVLVDGSAESPLFARGWDHYRR